MKVLSVMVGGLILAAVPASAQGVVLNDPLSPCWDRPAPTVREYRTFSGKVWDRKLWERGAPSHRAVAGAALREQCAVSGSVRRKMRGIWNRDQRQYGRWRALRKIAPYYFGEPTIPFVVIPPYIVRCETQGFYGASRWDAMNPSGATSLYQLLGWGAPAHPDTWKERMANHRIALHVLRVQGLSAWQCS